MESKNKLSNLESTISEIQKQYGKGAIMRLGTIDSSKTIDAISSGCLSLDIALGIGGIPKGRITEIFGSESSGKSTLSMHIVAEAQKNKGIAAYIDTEHALDPKYAGHCGVNIEELLVSQPDYAEQALEIVDHLVRSGSVQVIVVDSVAALVPKHELEGEMGDSHIGLQARLMSQALRKLTSSIHHSQTAVIFINQLREKVGVVFGNPEVTPGGRALKFYSSVRIDLRKIDTLKQGTNPIGMRARARIVKNKVSPPFKTTEFDIMFSKGISKSGDVLDLAITLGIVKKSGAFYYYGETKIGQGRENTKVYLEDNADLFASIEKIIKEKNGFSKK